MSAFNTYLPELIEVTLSADTSIFANNDIAADFQEVPGFFAKNGASATIHSITVIDGDDQGTALDIFGSRTGGTLGSENSGITISDANVAEVQVLAVVAAADFRDMINSMLCTKSNLGVTVSAAADSTSYYVGAVVRSGTPTYTAAGLKLRIWRTRH